MVVAVEDVEELGAVDVVVLEEVVEATKRFPLTKFYLLVYQQFQLNSFRFIYSKASHDYGVPNCWDVLYHHLFKYVEIYFFL